MSSTPQLHLDNQLCFSVYTLSRLITQAYQPLLKELGLTYPQYLVMLVLWEAEERGELPVPVRYVTEKLLLDTGTVTPLLKRMEALEVVVRSRSDRDERIVLVGLTAKGRELKEKASSVPGDILCQSGIDIERAEALRDEIQGMITKIHPRR